MCESEGESKNTCTHAPLCAQVRERQTERERQTHNPAYVDFYCCKVRACVFVCKGKRESTWVARVRPRVCVCVCVRERERERLKIRHMLFSIAVMCVRVRVCLCACARKRGRGREGEREGERENGRK